MRGGRSGDGERMIDIMQMSLHNIIYYNIGARPPLSTSQSRDKRTVCLCIVLVCMSGLCRVFAKMCVLGYIILYIISLLFEEQIDLFFHVVSSGFHDLGRCGERRFRVMIRYKRSDYNSYMRWIYACISIDPCPTTILSPSRSLPRMTNGTHCSRT